MKLTNNTKGPRIVNTKDGQVTLQPGESRDLDVHENDAKALKQTNHLGDQKSKGAPRPMGTEGRGPGGDDDATKLADANSKEQLLEVAKTEGVEGVEESHTKADIAAAIVKARQA